MGSGSREEDPNNRERMVRDSETDPTLTVTVFVTRVSSPTTSTIASS